MGETLLTSLFRHKAWANAGLLGAFTTREAGVPQAERHTAIRILNHVYVVDRIFVAHLQGVDHGYTGTNTKETPTLEHLSAAVSATDRWLLDYVAEAKADALAEAVPFTFTDGSRGRMSREEMLAHVITHGSYHRGQVSRLLPSLFDIVPSDLLTGYLHQAEPARRG